MTFRGLSNDPAGRARRMDEMIKAGDAPWNKSHRELYPDQYEHSLCGREVVVIIDGTERARGKVSRVVDSRFGQLATLEPDTPEGAWWRISDIQLLP